MKVLRPLLALVAVAVALILAIPAWDGIGAATDETSRRIFLVGWVVAVAVVAAGIASVPLLSRYALPLTVQHVVIGIVVGLAIGTTDWATLHFAGWWQLWWTVPLLLTYAGHLITLRGSSRTRP